MKVALVVGGSGMLAELSKKLSKEFEIVGVLARDTKKLNLLKEFSVNIIPICTDYTDIDRLRSKLDEFSTTYGKPELIVSWVHSTSPQVPGVIAEYCNRDFYEVTGESGKNSDDVSRQHEVTIRDLGLRYHRVILGHINDRWLTNKEISDGVYSGIQADEPEYVVGNI